MATGVLAVVVFAADGRIRYASPKWTSKEQGTVPYPTGAMPSSTDRNQPSEYQTLQQSNVATESLLTSQFTDGFGGEALRFSSKSFS